MQMVDEPPATGEWWEDKELSWPDMIIDSYVSLMGGWSKHKWSLTETVEEKKYSQHS